jgi:transcriptional regulator with XRE-family HTH domain
MGRKATKPAANHLRAWREYRKLTQEKLGELAQTTGAVIGLLESGERGLSDKWVNLLAPLLGTTPGHLRSFDPNGVDDDILEIWNDIPDEERPRAKGILQMFTRRQSGR